MSSRVDIPEEKFLAKLDYLDGVRQFFVQVWRENPALLKHGDPRLIDMMTPIWERDKIAEAAALKPA